MAEQGPEQTPDQVTAAIKKQEEANRLKAQKIIGPSTVFSTREIIEKENTERRALEQANQSGGKPTLQQVDEAMRTAEMTRGALGALKSGYFMGPLLGFASLAGKVFGKDKKQDPAEAKKIEDANNNTWFVPREFEVTDSKGAKQTVIPTYHTAYTDNVGRTDSGAVKSNLESKFHSVTIFSGPSGTPTPMETRMQEIRSLEQMIRTEKDSGARIIEREGNFILKSRGQEFTLGSAINSNDAAEDRIAFQKMAKRVKDIGDPLSGKPEKQAEKRRELEEAQSAYAKGSPALKKAETLSNALRAQYNSMKSDAELREAAESAAAAEKAKQAAKAKLPAATAPQTGPAKEPVKFETHTVKRGNDITVKIRQEAEGDPTKFAPITEKTAALKIEDALEKMPGLTAKNKADLLAILRDPAFGDIGEGKVAAPFLDNITLRRSKKQFEINVVTDSTGKTETLRFNYIAKNALTPAEAATVAKNNAAFATQIKVLKSQLEAAKLEKGDVKL